MGILIEDEDDGPPIYTGNAIVVTFPDAVRVSGGQPEPWRTITFPHFIHNVYVKDGVHNVWGSDLEIGMCFLIGGQYVPIINLDKEQLYHGMYEQELMLGGPAPDDAFPHVKYVKRLKEDGTQYWDILSNDENATK
jgi:hypothetical protein